MTSERPTRSIASRLLRINLLVSGTALLLAALAFFSYDLISFRAGLVGTLSAEGKIVGENSVSALLFNDRESALNTLRGLTYSPDILGAAIFAKDGSAFAEFGTHFLPRHFTPADAAAAGASWSSGRRVLVAVPIVLQGATQGTVVIAATLPELQMRAREYLLIALGILAVSWLTAIVATRSFRRMLAAPIIALAEMSREVSRSRNYSLRAPPPGVNDETAVLVEAFNDMLEQIEQRDSALRRARDELETRVKARTAELQAANRELEAFSYTVAHDLRGPLDAIGNIGYVLQQGYAAQMDEEGRAMLGSLRSSSGKMVDLIEDLLDLARSGSAAIDRQTVDLSRLAATIGEELRAAEPERRVELIVAPGAVAVADAALLRIVLNNLMRNAWKYTSHHPTARIEFGFQRMRGEFAYYVRDDGAGFKPELADRLFQPFHRLHTQAEFSGTGVGLATVQRIIARHGGKVWAESRPERGATFYFTLG